MGLPDGQRLKVLRLLSQHAELTGGEMIELDKSLPDGTVYTTLRRLETDKLVKSRHDTQRGLPGPPRRFYKITALGSRALAARDYADAIMSGAVTN